MFDAIGSFFDGIMQVLYYPVSGIMLAWHWVFTKVGLDPDSGWTWALSIVGLTITIRVLLIPLFVRQIKASRNMQLLQPKIRELQKKYGHDRERMAEEQMKLFREAGTNPFASCLPLILQMPIFFALFRVINAAARGTAHGFLSDADAASIKDATFAGVQIASRFTDSSVHVKIVCAILVVLMTATTFLTQRQLMAKNMPADAMQGPYAQQQKLLLYVLPFVFAISGVAFPVGVLLYWTTSNAWTMGQQFYVIRNNPAPGTPAYEAKVERDRKHGKSVAAAETAIAEPDAAPAGPRRQQPKAQSRKQRKGSGQPAGQSGAQANQKAGSADKPGATDKAPGADKAGAAGKAKATDSTTPASDGTRAGADDAAPGRDASTTPKTTSRDAAGGRSGRTGDRPARKKSGKPGNARPKKN